MTLTETIYNGLMTVVLTLVLLLTGSFPFMRKGELLNISISFFCHVVSLLISLFYIMRKVNGNEGELIHNQNLCWHQTILFPHNL